MSDMKKSKSAAPKTKRVSRTKDANISAKMPATKTKKADAKSKTTVVKTRKAKAETVAAPAAKRASKARTAVGRTKEPAAKKKMRKVGAEGGAAHRIAEPVVGPIGDVSSGEAATDLGDAELLARTEAEELQAEAAAQAAIDTPEKEHGNRDEVEADATARPPAKLERLQKILSQAGIASRRHAEEMIVAGRVMVNG